MRLTILACSFVLMLCAGCRTTPTAAPASPAATSIARSQAEARAVADVWTTPPRPKAGRTLERYDGASSERRAYVGDEVERRTRVGELGGGPLELVATLQSQYQFGSKLSGGGDAPDLWTNRFSLSAEKPTPLYGRVGAYAQYVNRQYSFSGVNGFLAGTERPFDLVHAFNFGVNVFQPVSEEWALFLSGTATWAAEDGADLSDGFGWSTAGGVGYRASDKLDLGLGAILSRSLGADSLYFIAGPQFDWRPNEHWQILLEGTTLEIGYRPNTSWKLSGGGGFTGHRFRLRKDGPGAGAAFVESGFPLWLQARYLGYRDVDVALRAGIDFDRSFSLVDRNGDTFRTIDSDPAPFVSLRFIWRL